MPYALRKVWDPAIYQGGGRRRAYFEGWYFKVVDAEGQHPFAVIPGVAWDDRNGTSHAFVQLLRANGKTEYFSYPSDAFQFSRDRFAVAVGDSRFTPHGVSLELHSEQSSVRGELTFGEWSPWPVRTLSPGIMGWYRFVPRMECYHGVLSMDHEVAGIVEVNGEELRFDGGRSYVEKDWGRSFPSAWLWAQTNSFADEPGVSVTASVAKIPWLGGHFIGFIAGCLHKGRLYRFATYSGAKLKELDVGGGTARIAIADRHHELALVLEGARPAALKAPIDGVMQGRADESLDATVHVTLRRLADGVTVFDGIGRSAGVELMDPEGELPRSLGNG